MGVPGDKLGRLALSESGCRKRDELVFEQAKKHQIPVMVTMGGGYAPDIATILQAHCNTFEAAARIIE
jgi:acetoin utilization deacetylase AcuC-like enzyme